MTAARYASRVPVHDDRTGPTKTDLNRLVVLHTTEGGETVTSAEQLAAILARPGDKPSTSRPGGFYGASYHWILDTDQVIPAVPVDVVSYSAPGANHDGIHVVFPGRAGQTRDQWLDPISRAQIRRCAELLVDLHRAGLGIPLRRLTVTDVVNGDAGYCDHKTITDAYHRTDHWDVGPAFPWDVLAADIHQLTNPPSPIEEPDVQTVITTWQGEPDLIELAAPAPGTVTRAWRGVSPAEADALIEYGHARDERDRPLPTANKTNLAVYQRAG